MSYPSVPRTSELFDLAHTLAAELLLQAEYPWQIVGSIKDFIIYNSKSLDPDVYIDRGDGIFVARDAVVAPTAYIAGPCIIDREAEIRHCAYIRGSAIVGRGAVVGNSCELKNCILFDGVQVPHFNYVGDSILGYKSHLGAGAVTSNVKSDKSEVKIRTSELAVETGRKKLGAILGDYVEVGCNSVLCPGTIVGQNTNIYPLSRVRGVIPANSIFKSETNITAKM